VAGKRLIGLPIPDGQRENLRATGKGRLSTLPLVSVRFGAVYSALLLHQCVVRFLELIPALSFGLNIQCHCDDWVIPQHQHKKEILTPGIG